MPKTTSSPPKHARSNLVTLIGMSAFFCVLTAAVLVPEIRELQDNRRNLLETEAQVNLLQQAITNRKSTQEDFLQLEGSSMLEQSLLSEADVIAFVEDIEREATAAGVTHSVRLETETRDVQPSVTTIPITIQATGDWTQLLSFLAGLERHNWYVNATQVHLSSSVLNETQQEILIQANSYWSTP